MILAIIPARKGSKRFPKKNLADFNGVSLLAHSILEAKKSGVFAKIIVSTDCELMAEEALKYGAEVPFIRNQNLATDTASSVDVVVDCLNFLNDPKFEAICLLQVTSPLRTSTHIKEAVSLYETNNHRPSVISFSNLNAKKSIMFNYLDKELNTIDIPGDLLKANGAIYITSVSQILTEKTFYTKSTIPFLMREEESVDVDYEIDLEVARLYSRSK